MCAVGDSHAAVDSPVHASRRWAIRTAKASADSCILRRGRRKIRAGSSSRSAPRPLAHLRADLLHRAHRLPTQHQPYRRFYHALSRRALRPGVLCTVHHAAVLSQLALPNPAHRGLLVHPRSGTTHQAVAPQAQRRRAAQHARAS